MYEASSNHPAKKNFKGCLGCKFAIIKTIDGKDFLSGCNVLSSVISGIVYKVIETDGQGIPTRLVPMNSAGTLDGAKNSCNEPIQ